MNYMFRFRGYWFLGVSIWDEPRITGLRFGVLGLGLRI